MSRIGKKPIPIPKGVSVAVEGSRVVVKGPKGSLQLELTGSISADVDQGAGSVVVRRGSDEREDRAKHGLYRALINNMVVGVTQGFEKRVELVGKDYNAKLQGRKLLLNIGYNSEHPEVFEVPQGITVTLSPTQSKEITEIVVQGIDKQLVGQVAASIRQMRRADPYQGKGFRYKGEKVRKLPGKQMATGAAAS
ncbi:MAG: 50S ribosomal protein L6 [Planctomycetota bacterium]|nr:50S ribosomal protein L6 [Planctomycetota bacterium]